MKAVFPQINHRIFLKIIIALAILFFQFNFIVGQSWNVSSSLISGSDTGEKIGNYFCMSSDGTVMAVGSPFHLNGSNFEGQVTVYEMVSGSWTQKGTLLTSGTTDDMFGSSLSLSSDGNIIAIGAKLSSDVASNAGKIWIYEYDGSAWNLQGSPLAGTVASEWFGASLELNASGDRLAIGIVGDSGAADHAGKVKIYEFDGTNWGQLGSDIMGSEARAGFGSVVAMSGDGQSVVISAGFSGFDDISKGYIRIVRYNGTDWVDLSPMMLGSGMGDLFGSSLAISHDGNTIAVGAHACNSAIGVDVGAVSCYNFDGTNWNNLGTPIEGDGIGHYLGKSIDLSNDGSTLAIGIPNNNSNGFMSGGIKVFNFVSTDWVLKGTAINGTNSFESFGSHVSISGDGNLILVGAPGESSVASKAGKVQTYQFY